MKGHKMLQVDINHKKAIMAILISGGIYYKKSYKIEIL